MKNKMFKYLINLLYEKLEPLVDAHITGRIVIFHQAMVRRGQIKPIPPAGSVEENNPK